jgi:hypothetical protein
MATGLLDAVNACIKIATLPYRSEQTKLAFDGNIVKIDTPSMTQWISRIGIFNSSFSRHDIHALKKSVKRIIDWCYRGVVPMSFTMQSSPRIGARMDEEKVEDLGRDEFANNLYLNEHLICILHHTVTGMGVQQKVYQDTNAECTLQLYVVILKAADTISKLPAEEQDYSVLDDMYPPSIAKDDQLLVDVKNIIKLWPTDDMKKIADLLELCKNSKGDKVIEGCIAQIDEILEEKDKVFQEYVSRAIH